MQDQPPFGIITLASYIKYVFSEIDVEAYDGKFFCENDLVDQLDSDTIGFSTWFRNGYTKIFSTSGAYHRSHED